MTAFANYEPRCITLQVCAACKVQLCSRFTQNPLTLPWWMSQTDLSFGKTPPLSTTYISLCRDSVSSAARLNEAAYVSPTCSRAHEENTAARRNIFATDARPLRTKCSEALRVLPASWWPALYNSPFYKSLCQHLPSRPPSTHTQTHMRTRPQ